MDTLVARKTWRTLEPYHGMIYFVPEGGEEYGRIGLRGRRQGYFASRAAALGPVPAEVVVATFFNFNPDLVAGAIPSAWSAASPPDILAARLRAADRALRRTLGDAVGSEEMVEAAGLARQAAQAATQCCPGRPLFAAHAALDWPDEAHLVLWHAQTLLREYRGDAHVAALLVEGLTGVQALVVHAATAEVPAQVLQQSRAWPDEDWQVAVEELRRRGLLAPGPALALSDAGRAHRHWVEEATDRCSTEAYRALGEEGCQRLRQLARPFSQAIVDAGALSGAPVTLDDD